MATDIQHAAKTRNRFNRWIDSIRATAERHGYAIGVHGSLERDVDLIAAPWADTASSADVLIAALLLTVRGFLDPGRVNGSGEKISPPNPCDKPHGRRAWRIIPADGVTYFDVSVMPRTEIKHQSSRLKRSE